MWKYRRELFVMMFRDTATFYQVLIRRRVLRDSLAGLLRDRTAYDKLHIQPKRLVSWVSATGRP